MRWTLRFVILLLLAAGCATAPHENSEPQVILSLAEYKPGDRTALVQIENKTKQILSYDGPYVEYLTNGNWTAYAPNVPEMTNIRQARRTGPTQTSVWWVRLPPDNSSWRAYIHARLFPLRNPDRANPKEFSVWSKEISR